MVVVSRYTPCVEWAKSEYRRGMSMMNIHQKLDKGGRVVNNVVKTVMRHSLHVWGELTAPCMCARAIGHETVQFFSRGDGGRCSGSCTVDHSLDYFRSFYHGPIILESTRWPARGLHILLFFLFPRCPFDYLVAPTLPFISHYFPKSDLRVFFIILPPVTYATRPLHG